MDELDGKVVVIKVPLDQWVKDIANHAAKEAAKCVIEDHRLACPAPALAANNTELIKKNMEMVNDLRFRWAKLTGIMIGSGILGAGGVEMIKRIFGG